MNFKEMANSGEFKFTVPEFSHSFDKEDDRKSRMAGEYMEKFYQESPYNPQAKQTFDSNAATYGVRNPYADYSADVQYKQGLDDAERRKDWKHDNT